MTGALPRKDKPAARPANPAAEPVPTENLEILREGFGLDVATASPASLQSFVTMMAQSMSASPYSSAEMLKDYVDRGFPELPGKVVAAIDGQTEHRQNLERVVTIARERRESRAQIGAQAVAVIGVLGALIGGYFGVPSSICVTVAIISVGGPNAATVVARLIDRVERRP